MAKSKVRVLLEHLDDLNFHEERVALAFYHNVHISHWEDPDRVNDELCDATRRRLDWLVCEYGPFPLREWNTIAEIALGCPRRKSYDALVDEIDEALEQGRLPTRGARARKKGAGDPRKNKYLNKAGDLVRYIEKRKGHQGQVTLSVRELGTVYGMKMDGAVRDASRSELIRKLETLGYRVYEKADEDLPGIERKLRLRK